MSSNKSPSGKREAMALRLSSKAEGCFLLQFGPSWPISLCHLALNHVHTT